MQLTVKDKKRIEAKFRQARAEFKRLVEETRALNEQIRKNTCRCWVGNGRNRSLSLHGRSYRSKLVPGAHGL